MPTGCLTLLGFFIFFVAGIIFLVFGALKSSEVYQTAVARAKADERVRLALGSNIHTGLFVSGSTDVSGSSGHADFAIPLAGSKGKGTIYVVAIKSAGQWQYTTLVVKTESGETIDLNAPVTPSDVTVSKPLPSTSWLKTVFLV